MSDYLDKVRAYVADADEGKVTTIVKYLGIALRSRDASLVSCTDPSELNRVRDGFCAKKLGLTKDDADAAIKKTCEEMKSDRNKHRVPFYYLVAKHSGMLDKL